MSGVEIRVRSDSTQARIDLARLERSVGSIEKSVQSATKAFSRMLVGIGATLASGAVTKSINNATDSLTNFQNRIALVTGRGKELNKTLDELFAISKRTRGSVEGSVEVFNRFGLALNKSEKQVNRWGRETIKQTSVANEVLLKAVENVNKAVAISGTGAQSANAALIQLGQGLASGQLRGQELNSVLEQAPRLAQAIADEMEIPFASLRKVAEQGQITSEVVFSALINQGEKLSKEFLLMEGTAGQALSVLGDQTRRLTADISKQLNITTGFTQKILAISDLIEGNRENITQKVVTTVRTMKTTFADTIDVLKAVGGLLGVIVGRAVDALPKYIGPMRTLVNEIGFVGVAVTKNFSRAINRANLDFGAFVARITGTGFKGTIRGLFQSRSLKEFAQNLRLLTEAVDSYGRRWYNFSNNLEQIFRSGYVQLVEFAIQIGIIEQRLARFRYESFERLSGIIDGIVNGFNQIKNSIRNSELFINFQLALLQIVQLLRNVGRAIDNSFGSPIERAIGNLNRLFSGITKSSRSSLGGAGEVISGYLEKIERKFFWLYNEVIANSWWTDTMEGVYSKAKEWLSLAASYVNTFLKKVEVAFRRLNEEFQLLRNLTKKDRRTIIQIRFEILKADALATLKSFGEAFGEIVGNSLSYIKDISPAALGFLSIGIAGAAVKAFDEDLFKAIGRRVGPAFALGLAASLFNVFGSTFNDQNIGRLLGEGIGAALAGVINQVFQAIPKLSNALLQVVKGFGNSIADELNLNIFTAIPKLIGQIPVVGGLMNTLLFGGITAAIFFKGVRTAMFNGLLSILTNPALNLGSAAGGTLISQLLIGTAAQRARILGVFGGTVLAANALVGDILGPGAATALGLAGGLILNLLMGGMTLAQIGTQASAAATAVATRIGGIFTAIAGSQTYAAFTGIIAQIRTLGVTGAISAAGFGASWSAALTAVRIRAATTANFIRARFLALSGVLKATAVLGALLIGSAAFASTGESAEEASSSILGLGLAAVLVAPLLVDLVKLLGKIPGVSALVTAASASIAASFTGLSASIGATFGGLGAIITLGIPTLLATLGSLAIVTAGGLVYSLFFGEGDTFLERVKDNFKKVGQFFGFFKRDVYSLRRDLLRSFEFIEKDFKKIDIDVNLSAKLKDVDLSSLGSRERQQLLDSSRRLERLNERANREFSLTGKVSEETRQAIKAAVESIDSKTLDAAERGKSEPLATRDALSSILTQVFDESSSPLNQALAKLLNEEQARLQKPTESKPGLSSQAAYMQAQTNVEESDLGKQLKLAIAQQDAIFEGVGLDKELGLEGLNLKNIDDVLAQIAILTPDSSEYLALTEFAIQQAISSLNLAQQAGVLEDGQISPILELLKTLNTNGIRLSTETLDIIRDNTSFLGNVDLEALGTSPEFSREVQRQGINFESEQLQAQRQKAITDIVETAETLGVSLTEELTESFAKLPLDLLNQIASDAGIAQGFFDKSVSLERLPGESDVDFNTRLKEGTPDEISDQLLRFTTAFTEGLRQATEVIERQTKNSEARLGLGAITTDSINQKLGGIGSGLQLETGAGSEDSLADIAAKFKEIEESQKEIARLGADLARNPNERARLIDAETAKQTQLNTMIGYYVEALNNANVQTAERVGIIETAAGAFTKFDIDINKLLAIDPATLATIVATQVELQGLQIELANVAALGVQVDPAIVASIEELEARLSKIFSSLGKGTIGNKPSNGGGGDKRSSFEKFQEGLSAVGFDFQLEDTLGVSSKIMSKLLGTTKEYAKVQKQINKLNVSDVENRNKLLDKMTEIRNQAFAALGSGTFGTLELALDGLGVDINLDELLKNPSVTIQDILADAARLAEIQTKIASLSVSQVALRRELDEEAKEIARRLQGESYGDGIATAFKDDFQSAFTELLSGDSDFGEFLENIVDSFTMKILNAFSEGFTEGLLGEEGVFAPLFDRIKNWGKSLTEGVSNAVQEGVLSGEGGGFGELFKNIGKFFKQILTFITGLFGGGTTVTASAGGTIPGGSQFQMLAAGGMINPQYGKDSVPAMLMPGEYVVDSRQTAQVMKNMSKQNQQQQVFNINVSGDISRQTRKEIVKMMPEITSGVNMTNRERGGRR